MSVFSNAFVRVFAMIEDNKATRNHCKNFIFTYRLLFFSYRLYCLIHSVESSNNTQAFLIVLNYTTD